MLVTLNLKENDFRAKVFELLQFMLFDNSGSIYSINEFNLAIEYIWPNLNKKKVRLNQKSNLTKALENIFPLPFNQSPVPHPEFLYPGPPNSDLLDKKRGVIPEIVSTGSTNLILSANFLPQETRFTSWSNRSNYQFKLLPKYPVKTLNELSKASGPLTNYCTKIKENFLKPHIAMKISITPNEPKKTTLEKSTQTEGQIIMIYNQEQIEQAKPKPKRKYTPRKKVNTLKFYVQDSIYLRNAGPLTSGRGGILLPRSVQV